MINIEKIWFTSDHHFGHDNIRRFCDRPFDSIELMDGHLIAAWNDAISFDKYNQIFHLGDFTLGYDAEKYTKELNGSISFLFTEWHHDKRWIKSYPVIFSKSSDVVHYLHPVYVLEYKELSLDGDYPLAITLSHYPFAEWDRKHYGAWNLHGHSHGNYRAEGKILDVGVDNAYKLLGEYRPFNLKEIIEIMETK